MPPPNNKASAAAHLARRVVNQGAQRLVVPPGWRALFAGAEGPVPIDLTRSFGLPHNATWFQLAEAVAANLTGYKPINLT